MDIKTSLYLSYAVIGLSLAALAFSIFASVMGLKLSAAPTRTLQVASMLWPMALYAAAVYRRKLAQDAEKSARP